MNERPVFVNLQQPPAVPQAKMPRKRFEITLKDIVCLIALFVCSVLVSSYGIFGGFRGGFTVSSMLLTVLMSVYLLGKGYKFKLFPAFCLILSMGVSLGFLITSNGAVRFWSFVSIFVLNITWFTLASRDINGAGDADFFPAFISPIGETFKNLPTMFVSLFSSEKKGSKTFPKVLIGIGASLQVLLIVIPLLMSSDEAFQGMIEKIFGRIEIIIFKIVLGVAISIFVVSYALSLKKDKKTKVGKTNLAKIEAAIVIPFLSLLSVCYLSYLFSQLAYFFDAFKGFLPEGYEYNVAEYARRGFFEMGVIAAINLVVISLCRIFARRQGKKSAGFINGLSTFVGIFTLIIIATALRKMALYIDSFGMTRLRITTSMFMLFLGIVFVSLMLSLYIKKVSVIKTAFAASAIILILLGTLNVNKVVAEYNYNAYKDGALDSIDIYSIAELGDEGIPYLVKLSKDKNEKNALYAKYKLSEAYECYYTVYNNEEDKLEIDKKMYDEIGQYSIPRQKAYDELEKFLKDNPDILEFQKDYYEYDGTIEPLYEE